MKLCLPVAALLFCVPTLLAQKKEKSDLNVTVTLDLISVSRADAFGLMRMDSAAMWAKVGEMIKSGVAKSEGISAITTNSGERTIAEFIQEMRYPTEFEPPGSEGEKKEQAKDPKASESLLVADRVELYPTAFETRNIGSTMEVLPTVRGSKIDLQILPSSTRLDGFLTYPRGAAEKGLPTADQPQFQNFKLQTNVTVESGKPLFLGTGDQDPAREGAKTENVLLFFVTATVVSEQ